MLDSIGIFALLVLVVYVHIYILWRSLRQWLNYIILFSLLLSFYEQYYGNDVPFVYDMRFFFFHCFTRFGWCCHLHTKPKSVLFSTSQIILNRMLRIFCILFSFFFHFIVIFMFAAIDCKFIDYAKMNILFIVRSSMIFLRFIHDAINISFIFQLLLLVCHVHPSIFFAAEMEIQWLNEYSINFNGKYKMRFTFFLKSTFTSKYGVWWLFYVNYSH